MNPDRHTISEYFRGLQDEICAGLENVDGQRFREDSWERPGGGGGRARVIEGDHIEKGGVNFSAVHGELPAAAATSLKLSEAATNFFATGVSIVLHPRNPHVPIIHMNVRYFELDGSETHWFGGGIDLTPHYVSPPMAGRFHAKLQATCDRFDPSYYPRFKEWADNYFFLPHRNETRGVGGIFYDRLAPNEAHDKADNFAFTRAVGETFLPAYLEQFHANKDSPYTQRELDWQRIRRGRYVEFNLVWDRGTKFGLTTNGRTESILMSLPPMAGWTYNHQPTAGSREEKTLSSLSKGVNWIALSQNEQ